MSVTDHHLENNVLSRRRLADNRVDGVPQPIPPARLVRIAASLAQQPSLWADAVRFDAEHRYSRRFVSTEEYEAWLLTWLPGQATGLHDHGESAGAFAVVRGRLHESTVDPAAGLPITPVVRALASGQVRAFGPAHIHDVANRGPEPAVSLHVYAPRLRVMTRYATVGCGLVTVGVDQAGADW
jgi:mannose-6-phosphate isomerase-like protein (cupin superfamily)